MSEIRLTVPSTGVDEIDAARIVWLMLEGLDADARKRVLRSAWNRVRAEEDA